MPLARIEEAIEDYRQGKMVIIIDDEDRENEGDLCMAAEKVTPEAINFMARFGRGLICMPVTGERLDELQIPMMVSDRDNSSGFGTAFTVSIEAKNKVSTGISAHDRAATVLAVINPNTKPHDIAKPGHMFPLRARPGGVLQRAGQTEASLDMAKLAGLYPAAVICEIMNEDGTMARLPQLEIFAKQHDLKIISIESLIAYRKQKEILIAREAETRMPTGFGEFRAIVYRNIMSGTNEVALVKGDIADGAPVLARIHSECLTGDVFGSVRCDCGAQLQQAMQMIQAEGRGLILYMRQEGRGIGLHNKIKAYALQDEGYDTVEANVKLGFKPDLRDYGIGAQILADLGVSKLRLLTNNPKKVIGIQAHGLEIVEIVPIEIEPNPDNLRYLEAKRDKMGHLLHLPESEPEIAAV
jgi:3,4-dihydroxy 2-butanone 4-phosphate synthase / GTP cyclohydrolase II